jgi:hypothetical protein
MAKKKSETAVKEYTALTNLINNKTGATFAPGDTVQDGDFPADIIKAWLDRNPPRLEVKS